jgi:hypothetical protein
VTGAIVVLVAPSFALLFWLARAGRLGETEAPAARGGADGSGEQVRVSGLATVAVMALVAAEGIRRLRAARRSE